MKYFKRNGFVALVSMLSLAAYAEDILPLSVAGSETKEFIQASGYGIDTSNMIQQERIIQGTVLEEGTNEPLIGVNVVVKGTTIGTTTDIDGKYSIKIPSDKAVLVFSYIGQKTEEYSVKGLSLLNVVMKSDATMLSEVVVYTGYMTQKKADLTGSVAMASASDLKKNASANAMKSLQGKMAGVHITTNGGNPAEGATVQIRGLSSLSGGVKPLIVLDGMPTENLNLRDINAGDIESIQVLKDAASASIYGARASGGVILIQTKKGQAGKTSIEYNGSVSINTVLNKPALMNAEQYGRAAFQAQAYDERVYGTSISLPSAYDYTWHRGDNGMAVLDGVKVAEFLNADQTVRGSDTDWMGEVFQTAVSHNHQLTISNGSEKSKSLFSLGYFNNEGTQIHTFFRQYSVRANTEYSLIKNRLKVGENLAVSYLQYRDQSETWWAMINPPASPVYDENGGWAGAPGFDDFTNPVRLLKMNKDNINNYVKIIGNIFLDLNIWKGISARTQFGLDYGNAYNRAVDGVWSETGGRNSDGENYVGSYQSHPLSYVWTNTLSYTLSTGKHNLDVVLGTEATRFVQEGFSARREGIYLEDRDFAHIGVTTGEKYNLGSSADEYTYFSLFGKANYVYNGKYSALFDGEYFIQKIQWEGLQAPNPVDVMSFGGSYSEEALKLLKEEGPKYQYGTGCLSDGILGMWMASVCGLDEVLDNEKVRSHLVAVHKYNLKHDLIDHFNPQRPVYACGKDGGLLLCTWPKGGMLSLPFVYSNEVWTGIEYQVASHLMMKGEVEKGLDIVRECRERYDGRVRNPFNEIECGHWYARAMASYGMLQGLTGVRYDAVDKTMYINSKIGDFKSFISTDTGFGTIEWKAGKPVLNVVYGNIDVKRYNVSGKIVD